MKVTRLTQIVAFVFAFSFLSCVTGDQKTLEEIGFLLDDGEFTEAITKARGAVANDPTNPEARFLLASALLGDAALSGGNDCAAEDTGWLGLIACLQDEQQTGESGFLTFNRIAPQVTDKLANLEEAANILAQLFSEGTAGSLGRDVCLQLYVARLFEISGAITRIGATSENEICNAIPGHANKDEIPDDFAPNALNETQSIRFDSNLNTVNANATCAGLPSDFALGARILSIASDLTAAIAAAAGDLPTGVEDFFTAEFASGTKADCDEPK